MVCKGGFKMQLGLLSCVDLLYTLVLRGYIKVDPKQKNNILLYKQNTCYSKPILEAAAELVNDVDGQTELRKLII